MLADGHRIGAEQEGGGKGCASSSGIGSVDGHVGASQGVHGEGGRCKTHGERIPDLHVLQGDVASVFDDKFVAHGIGTVPVVDRGANDPFGEPDRWVFAEAYRGFLVVVFGVAVLVGVGIRTGLRGVAHGGTAKAIGRADGKVVIRSGAGRPYGQAEQDGIYFIDQHGIGSQQ